MRLGYVLRKAGSAHQGVGGDKAKMKNATLEGGRRLGVQGIGRRSGQAPIGRFHWRTPWLQYRRYPSPPPWSLALLSKPRLGIFGKIKTNQ